MSCGSVLTQTRSDAPPFQSCSWVIDDPSPSQDPLRVVIEKSKVTSQDHFSLCGRSFQHLRRYYKRSQYYLVPEQGSMSVPQQASIYLDPGDSATTAPDSAPTDG